jgi:hypothetical protein
MFTCCHCKLEKQDSDKGSVFIAFKIGYFCGTLLLFAMPFLVFWPKWPADTCRECQPVVMGKGFLGLFFTVVLLAILICLGVFRF